MLVKILLLAMIGAVLLVQNAEAALKCYSCPEGCEVSKAQEKVCGVNIGPSQEPVCTTEIPKDSKTPKVSVRKCQVVQKDTQFTCPDGSTCNQCKSELCNGAPSFAPGAALLITLATYFAAKSILHY